MIRLYTTHCPQCIILVKKLQEKGLEFEEINDIEIIKKVAQDNKLSTVPILDFDGEILNFSKSIQKINTL